MNKYYIIQANDVNLEHFITLSSGNMETQRFSLDGTEVVLDLINYDNQCPILALYVDINYNDLLTLMATDKWSSINF